MSKQAGDAERYRVEHLNDFTCHVVGPELPIDIGEVRMDVLYEDLEEAENVASCMNYARRTALREARAEIKRLRAVAEAAKDIIDNCRLYGHPGGLGLLQTALAALDAAQSAPPSRDGEPERVIVTTSASRTITLPDDTSKLSGATVIIKSSDVGDDGNSAAAERARIVALAMKYRALSLDVSDADTPYYKGYQKALETLIAAIERGEHAQETSCD